MNIDKQKKQCEETLKEQGNICIHCGGRLYIKGTLWYGDFTYRIKCQDCGHIY